MRSIEFGDFQTPQPLAERVVQALQRWRIAPRSIFEPTVGRGELLAAALSGFPSCDRALGLDINQLHLRAARSRVLSLAGSAKVSFGNANVFDVDLKAKVGALPKPVLILGNPPWVTSATLGTLGSDNLPAKNNRLRRSGLDAITGKSNFDISEWIILRLLEALGCTEGVLAMLCKTKVARRVLSQCCCSGLAITRAAMFAINAFEHFGASVEACLFVCERGSPGVEPGCDWYDNLDDLVPSRRLLFLKDFAVADATSFHRARHLLGTSPLRWRSGVKHDCATVMELQQQGGSFVNARGETIDIERDHLFPLLKGSGLARGQVRSVRRWMLVPQRKTGDLPARLQVAAPKTWKYLVEHRAQLGRRASSVYKRRPEFCVFGVGDYTFTRWKVAVSALAKTLAFQVVGPIRGKPVVFDDTCYLLACESELQARTLHALLCHPLAHELLESMIFWGDKRPITSDLLERLDLQKLAAVAARPVTEQLVLQGHERATVRRQLQQLAALPSRDNPLPRTQRDGK